MSTPVLTREATAIVPTHEPVAAPGGLPARMRLDFVDGLRGLAALFVVAHHLWLTYTMVALPGVAGACANCLLYGHLAVDVFIVLSGFCLMLPVARSGGLRGGWKTFYKSRCRRILPPLYAAIALAVASNLFYHLPVPVPVVLSDVFLVSDIWQNGLDAPLWSVCIEWKIYLLFPAFVGLWLRCGPLAVLAVAAAVSAVLFGVITPLSFIAVKSHLCPWYLFLFAMGMVATVFAQRREVYPPSWLLPTLLAAVVAGLAAALLTWPITSQGEEALYAPHLPVIDTLAGAVTAILLLMLGRKALRNEPSLANALLACKPLVFVGTMGYSLYLIHDLLIYHLKNALLKHLPFDTPLLIIPMEMGIVVGISYGFHLVFERPFMAHSRRQNAHLRARMPDDWQARQIRMKRQKS